MNELTSSPPLLESTCNDLRYLASSRSHKGHAYRSEASAVCTGINSTMSFSDIAIAESSDLCAHHSDAGTDMTPIQTRQLSGEHWELDVRLAE